jgi:preprotein translocase subunit SecG
MITLLTVLHVIFCLFLILVILLQTGKGAGMGSAFGGGGSSTVFGPRGAGSFIGKATGIVAALFMVTSLSLAFFSSSKSTSLEKRALEEEEQHGEEVDIEGLSDRSPAGETEQEKNVGAASPNVKSDAGTAGATDSGTATADKPAVRDTSDDVN